MNKTLILEVGTETRRFMQRAAEVLQLIDDTRSGDVKWLPPSPETAALRRASMDLTRALAKLRK
jgi:hypothetical protein